MAHVNLEARGLVWRADRGLEDAESVSLSRDREAKQRGSATEG